MAGLRRNEIDKLPWSAFRWNEGIIESRQQRSFARKSVTRKATYWSILNCSKYSGAIYARRKEQETLSSKAIASLILPLSMITTAASPISWN